MRITSTNKTNGKKITVNKNYDKWQLQCTAIWRTAHAAAVILGFNYEVHNALATNSTILQRTFQQPVSIYQCLWPNLYSACTATAIYEKKRWQLNWIQQHSIQESQFPKPMELWAKLQNLSFCRGNQPSQIIVASVVSLCRTVTFCDICHFSSASSLMSLLDVINC